MRIHDLLIQSAAGPFRLPFHEHVTVVSGLTDPDRESLAEALLGSMTGDVDDAAELRYVDHAGRKIVMRAAGGTVEARAVDGGEVEPVVGSVVQDADHLRALTLIRPDHLRVAAVLAEREPEELSEARAQLQELDDEIHAVTGRAERLERITHDLATIDIELAKSNTREARREFARLLRRRDELHAERATIDDPARARADEELLDRANEARRLADRWQDATIEAVTQRDRFGTTERLDAETVARLRSVPDDRPENLHELLATYADAEQHRSELNDRLRAIAADRLPEPSDPIVPQLARHDQDELWGEHQRVVAAAAALSEARAGLDGVGSDNSSSSVELMEEAHRQLVLAEDRSQRWLIPSAATSTGCAIGALVFSTFVPALAALLFVAALVSVGLGIVRPRLAAKSAALAEASAAQQTGASSYLGFHLRRLEASLDRGRRQRVEVAELEHRLAVQCWTELTGGIDPVTIAPFEHEVRNYHRAVLQLGHRASEIEEIGDRLETAERACADAARALESLCDSYAIDNPPIDEPEILERLIDHQLKLRAIVPMQDELDAAEQDLAIVEASLVELLELADLEPSVSTTSLDQLDRAVEAARGRCERRAQMRSREDVERDLHALEREIAAATTADLADVTADEVDAPDDDELHARKAELEQERDGIADRPVDLPRIRERREALARRVTKLEASLMAAQSGIAPAVVAEVERQLQGRFAGASALGSSDERLPLVLDDAFEAVPAGRKWDLLDMLRRMAERNQVLYLTDDPFVTAWARTRASEGAVRLLEAESEDATAPGDSGDGATGEERDVDEDVSLQLHVE